MHAAPRLRHRQCRVLFVSVSPLSTFCSSTEYFLSRGGMFSVERQKVYLIPYVIARSPKERPLLVQTDEELQTSADTIARGDASFMQEDGILDDR